MNRQQSLFPEFDQESNRNRSGTFTDNMKLPIHRWFRYSAGFSAEWVIHELKKLDGKDLIDAAILDPFAGSATTLLAADSIGFKSVGFESHPFICRVAKAKLNWNVDYKYLEKQSEALIRESKASVLRSERIENPLLGKCYSPDALNKLDSIRSVFLKEFNNNSDVSELIWLAITSIIRITSKVGTAQWQYVLPNKTKLNVQDPFDAFEIKMKQIIEDIIFAKKNAWASASELICTDARSPSFSEDKKFDFVITSPPYPNNYDYADATRLELTFWGEVDSWGDLHNAVRQYLIRSCSQHSAKEKLVLDSVLEDEILDPIRHELTDACKKLEVIRLNKGGRKTYHTMAAAYFKDLAYVLKSLRNYCKPDSTMCFVIGDSAPYGVYLSVDKWLGELALSVGFRSYEFEKIRDRNIKWDNRTHKVPLKEGRLWIRG